MAGPRRPGTSRDRVLEPQAQSIWVGSRQDGITEPTGTVVGDSRGSGWIGRLGVRTRRT
ncbi:autotransporter outer membrane beta-barrel domain-containing protein [Variovorax robiniae]|uniref:autotransporter outer membrane beta-barrel domain-containing protein n=1 Tax=Variovorax robiniae TaxID=1836199 RepID=UPI003BF60EC4